MDSVGPPLHLETCQQTDQDLERMTDVLSQDAEALERITWLPDPLLLIEDSYTPLQLAIKSRHIKCVEFLISCGAKIDRNYGFAGDAVCSAISFNSLEILRLLVSKYNMLPSNDKTDYADYRENALYLHKAARLGSPEVIQFLLDSGANTECEDYFRQSDFDHIIHTPAIEAIMYEKVENLKILLINGAVTDFENAGFIFNDSINYDILSMHLRIAVSFINNLHQKVQLVNILYGFGVNLLKPAKTGENVIDLLLSDTRIKKMKEYLEINEFGFTSMEFPLVQRQELAEYIKSLFTTPMSLKGQCRLSIIRSLGKTYCKQISKLSDIPRELMDFLLFR